MKRTPTYNRKGEKAMSATAHKIAADTGGKMPINTQWFKDRIADKTTRSADGRMVVIYSQNQLAKNIGIDRASLSRVLNGEQRMTPSLGAKIAAELGVPFEDVMRAAGIDTGAGATDMVPVTGVVSATGLVKPGRAREGAQRVPGPRGMPTRAEALRYLSDDHKHGWVAFYVPSTRVERDVMGHLCVAVLADGTSLVRMIRKGSRTGLWDLVDVLGNGQPLRDVQVSAAASVCWLQTWV